LSLALESIDQSYSVTVNGTTSEFVDTPAADDVPGAEPAGISVQQPANEESESTTNGNGNGASGDDEED
jgi:hypothetical protein